MKVLVITPILRTPERVFFYPQAMQSIYDLKWKWRLDHLSGSGWNRDNALDITEKLQEGRRIAIEGNYDAILTAESDMIIPQNALQRLADLNSDVAYSLYVLRLGKRYWTAYTEVKTASGKSLSQTPSLAQKYWNTVLQVAGIGFGCTLIRRHVFEAMEFRCRPQSYPDWVFSEDCQQYGVDQVCDLGLHCGHIDKGNVLWPDVNAEDLYRTEKL